jgi:hypothetical protein
VPLQRQDASQAALQRSMTTTRKRQDTAQAAAVHPTSSSNSPSGHWHCLKHVASFAVQSVQRLTGGRCPSSSTLNPKGSPQGTQTSAPSLLPGQRPPVCPAARPGPSCCHDQQPQPRHGALGLQLTTHQMLSRAAN